MPGLADVVIAIRSIGAAATETAKEVVNAADYIERARQQGTSASASVSGPGGSGATGGSVGASNGNSNVTSRGMSAALSVARRSL